MRFRLLTKLALALGVPAMLLTAAPLVAGAEPGYVSGYAQVLERHTSDVDATVGTRVDYEALRREPRWTAVVRALGQVDPAALKTREERLAFWINAYNILAIDIVLRNYPIESIKDIGSFISPVWGKDAGAIAGRAYSLGEIEHEILRKMNEPRIHGAIVCASISCPNLLREPFVAERLGAQLDDSIEAWLKRPEKGLRVDRAAAEVTLSPIFDWFEDDFEAAGGVMAFVTRYAPPADRAWLREHGARADVEYFDYDWRLNR